MTLFGIDVSRWQGTIDWRQVKDSKLVSFVMIKTGGSDKGFYKDPKYDYNYTMCKALGIPCGAYYFAGPRFLGERNGVSDAKRFIDQLAGRLFEFPVVLDIEAQPAGMKKEVTDAAIAFCRKLEEAGYYAMIYASDYSGLVERLDYDRLSPFDLWIASYGKPPKHRRGIWQYSSTGKIPGIIGNVDLNICYNDYEKIIKRAGLNGWKKEGSL